MKKILVSLVLTVSLVIGGIALIACNSGKSTPKANTGFSDDKSLFAFSAISTANALSVDENVMSKTARRTNNTSTSEINIEIINQYLEMMESLLVDNGPILVSEGVSDLPEYSTKLVYSVKSLSGEVEEYQIYYNQELLVDDEEDDDDKDFDDLLDKDDESEYRLTGIAIIGNEEYQIIGEKELEENELEMTIRIIKDDNNYVVIEQEIEKNEVEYEYTVYKNGRKTLSLSMEVENNNEVEIKFTTNENGVKETYKFSKETISGNEVIKIKYQSTSTNYTIKVKAITDTTTNEVIYEYEVVESGNKYQVKHD